MDLNEFGKALLAHSASLDAHTKALNAFGAKAGGTPAAAGKPAAGGKPAAAGKPATVKAISDEDMRSKVGDYVAGASDEDDRVARRDNVKAMLTHFAGIEGGTTGTGATGISKAHRAQALAYVKQFEAGETPDFMEGGEEEEAGDDLLG